MRDFDEGKMLFRCHLHRNAKSPRGETYTISIDRRGVWLGNGRLAWLSLPIGWLLHRWRWPDHWWLSAARSSLHLKDFRQWNPTIQWRYGPFIGEDHARAELSQLIELVESGRWYEGQLGNA
ncbi:MAG: hypothetical protein QOF21_2885 [Actinomycetota bacterium]